MRVRLTKIDEFQFLTCLKNKVWGSNSPRFKDWKEGDSLVFIIDKTIAGLAEVAGKPYVSRKPLWNNSLFPHRIPLKFTHAFQKTNRFKIQNKRIDALIGASGLRYHWRILNQQLIEGDSAEIILNAIRSGQNDLSCLSGKAA